MSIFFKNLKIHVIQRKKLIKINSVLSLSFILKYLNNYINEFNKKK